MFHTFFVKLGYAATSIFAAVNPTPVDYHAEAVAPSITELSVVSEPAPGVEYTNINQQITCSFAFKAQKDGVDGFLTAGHCVRPGDQVAIKTAHGLEVVGTATWSLGTDGQTTSQDDLAFIQTTGSANVAIVDKAPGWTFSIEDLKLSHPDMCKVGPKSGGTCGPVKKSDILANTVQFPAESLHGDSGSPIFARKADGSLVAVALLSGSPEGDSGMVLGQLIDDATLARYHLTIKGS